MYLLCSSLKDHLSMFNECANTLLERLRPVADGKTEVSMKEAFHEMALDAISKVWRTSCCLSLSTHKKHILKPKTDMHWNVKHSKWHLQWEKNYPHTYVKW